MSTAQGITYRPAAPGDVKLLTRLLWVAFNWRDESVSEEHWPDPTAAAKYVDGFGRHGDAGAGRSGHAPPPESTPFGTREWYPPPFAPSDDDREGNEKAAESGFDR